MRPFKTLALVVALSLPASFAAALDIQGSPILSDGTNAMGLQRQQGIHEINACGESYWIGTQEGMSNYKRMKPQLEKGGYVYYHTTDPSKRFYPCAWGRYEHLSGEVF
ncbi:hypothetical protein [Aliiroseovarius lamellibrachiae]|uniref:hypothetical protein n=1 Tax=Aliiroseovarius lamellibrachiae TaxID=1924933 RepID=UPI001BDFA2CA|nr:hypothetical protein [Aliiroseovarius lamellibrachiae]MBT2131944.1 hypothetical protein [Aliiroseovarius lamellibrachiae]